MKKLAILLLITIVLAACGGGSELDSFVNDFNQSARKYDAAVLVKDEFGELERDKDLAANEENEEVAKIMKESNEAYRELFSSKEYTIGAYYEENKLVGYNISVKSEYDYIDKDEKGYNALLTMTDAIGVDIDKLEVEASDIFEKKHHKYNDGDYEISLYGTNIATTSLSVTFEKN